VIAQDELLQFFNQNFRWGLGLKRRMAGQFSRRQKPKEAVASNLQVRDDHFPIFTRLA
jgi:hypothetical protein